MNHFGDLWHRMERLVHMTGVVRRDAERKMLEAAEALHRRRTEYVLLHRDISRAVTPEQEELARRLVLASTEEFLDQIQSTHSIMHRCHDDAEALKKTIQQLRENDDE